ncbi:hypothetical protein MAPG_08695 [Magnaporthiopsis poae ATCC 64411]|uniref:Uncharacterized protein n=1 Tax=Magnaporthiopsis poae (strain ATCC 64411 / 73-15) TaxID=644358 RepID=A0A0C4E809_MAGP6|nr:hypothetical protein MAPG_08695 [Magnaporthiopsis poae ATCC 64411]
MYLPWLSHPRHGSREFLDRAPLDASSRSCNPLLTMWSTFLLASAAILGAGARLTKPLIQPPIPPLDAGLFANLNAPSSWYDSWEWGWIPDRCCDVGNSEKKNFPGGPYDIEVFNVHYADCDMAWVMCRRHHQADMSKEQMIDLFGRMPVRMRQWIRLVIAMPGTAGSRRAARQPGRELCPGGGHRPFRHRCARRHRHRCQLGCHL